MSEVVLREREEGLLVVSNQCPLTIYVKLRLPDDIHSVNRVIFRTVSHDQGFSNEKHLYGGTYKNSNTWFATAVVTPGGHNRVPVTVLQYNVHASAEFRKHEVCWSADSEDPSIRNWVNAIRGGDTIQVIPKAQYRAWLNFVQMAEIEVHGTKTLPDIPLSALPRPIEAPGTAVFHHGACYRSLDEGAKEIRLITLNPGTHDEPISCSLVYTSLQEPRTIAYEALSYCWGDPRQRCDILLRVPESDGDSEYAMPITATLHSAMKNLRRQAQAPCTLWIDAICINQADVGERSNQVALMREIYRSASMVIVWLGDGDQITQKSIQTINTISDRYEQSDKSNIAGTDLARLHDPLMKDLGVDTFVDEWPLFDLPWFRRTWVVQEIFNARQSIIRCGDSALTWPMLLRVNKCIRLSDLKANSSYKVLMPPIFEDLFDSRVVLDTTVSTDTEILDVLIKGLDLDATDPRDKIFAMLQFGRETRNLNLLPLDIVPDYRKTTSEVFSNFTKWWIVKHRSLRILSAIQALEGRTWQDTSRNTSTGLDAEQPSWSWWYRGHSNWAIGILGLSVGSSYRAAAGTQPDVDMIMKSLEPTFLPLVGVKISTIEKVVPYPYFRPPPDHEELHRAYVGIFDPLNFTGKWMYQLGSKNASNYATSDNSVRMRDHFNAHFESARTTAALKCHSNCFFTTPEGLIGLCPFSARKGDLIVILYGGPVPYVLRSRNGIGGGAEDEERKYEFIGECYLQGYMEGRGIEEQQEKDTPTEVFNLL